MVVAGRGEPGAGAATTGPPCAAGAGVEAAGVSSTGGLGGIGKIPFFLRRRSPRSPGAGGAGGSSGHPPAPVEKVPGAKGVVNQGAFTTGLSK